MSAERLQKVLASAGIASRRDCEALIAAGRVTVNGRVVQEPGTRVDLEQDAILVDGAPVRQPSQRTYIMLHKPAGFVSTVDDPHGRPTVVELVDVPTRVFPVGRLDVDSEGLILLTDDGELTHHLTHPKFEVEKEYRVLLDRPLEADALREWRNGLLLNGEMTAPAKVALAETTDEGVWYVVVLREGRKRQIRETAKTLGYEVRRLIRIREGDLLLGDLALREYRPLSDEEVAGLRAHVPARPPREESAQEDEGRRYGAGAAGAAGAAAAAGVAYSRRDDAAGGDGPRRPRPDAERDGGSYGRREDRPREGYGPSRERDGGSYGRREDRPREGYGPSRERGYGPPRDDRSGPPRESRDRGYGPPRDDRSGPPRESRDRGYGPPRDDRSGPS
ncbi:MAG: pseudouridine synthase, partial [Chloroflexales bacterium]|nr:pseudouridine synthase [Chloroflexales bacterium]